MEHRRPMPDAALAALLGAFLRVDAQAPEPLAPALVPDVWRRLRGAAIYSSEVPFGDSVAYPTG